jgi:ribulose-phosphate 3-epimerase
MKALIAPSILSADFTRLGEQIAESEQGGADWIHVDVMDGHFVPNITIGPMIVEAARRVTKLPLDVHLMIENPDRYIVDFLNAGANWLTVHQETCPHLHRTVQKIRELGAHPGVALNPATPVETLIDILPFVDLVLVMTVNPGFGGQRFITQSLPKVTRLARLLEAAGLPHVQIEVDGGIDPKTAPGVVSAGATVLVAGSAVFSQGSIKENIQAIRRSLTVEV